MIKTFKKKKNNKGFTLVEVLVVIAIIGVLAVVAVPALFKNINKSKAAKVEADYGTIRTAVLAEFSDGKDITTITDLSTLDVDGLSSTYTVNGTPTATTFSIKVTVDNKEVANKIFTDLGTKVVELPSDTETNGNVIVKLHIIGDDASTDVVIP